MQSSSRLFGPAGMLESEDADNMESFNHLNRGYITRECPLNRQMAMGDEREDAEMPGVVVDSANSELAHRGFYRFYQELLSSPSWSHVRGGDTAWKRALLP